MPTEKRPQFEAAGSLPELVIMVVTWADDVMRRLAALEA